jgi:hypothetical protein
MIWGAVLECIARALRMLGFTRKPVKVLFLGLENAGKTTLMFAMKHGPRAAYDIAHDPTFGLSALSPASFLFLFLFFSFAALFCAFFLFSGFALFALRALRNTKKPKKKTKKTKKTQKNQKKQKKKKRKPKRKKKNKKRKTNTKKEKNKKKKKLKKKKKQISRRWTWRDTKCARTISVGNSATFGPTTSFRLGASFSSSTRRTPIGSPSPKPNSTCAFLFSFSFFLFSFSFFLFLFLFLFLFFFFFFFLFFPLFLFSFSFFYFFLFLGTLGPLDLGTLGPWDLGTLGSSVFFFTFLLRLLCAHLPGLTFERGPVRRAVRRVREQVRPGRGRFRARAPRRDGALVTPTAPDRRVHVLRARAVRVQVGHALGLALLLIF